MNGASTTKTIPRNITVEDDPEPGDPPPQPRSPSVQPPAKVDPPKLPASPQFVSADTETEEEPENMTQLAYTNALIRQATIPILPPDLDDFGIPPSPPGSPDPTLVKKIENFLQLRDTEVYFNDKLGTNRGFRNPKLLEKLRGYVGIEDEYGSNLLPAVWNPHGFTEDQYYDTLAEKQKKEFDALQARQLNEQRSSIEFASSSTGGATAKSAAERVMEGLNSRPTSRPVSRTGGEADRKRSRYDDKRDDRGYARDKRDDRRRSRSHTPERDRDRDRHRTKEPYYDRDYRRDRRRR